MPTVTDPAFAQFGGVGWVTIATGSVTQGLTVGGDTVKAFCRVAVQPVVAFVNVSDAVSGPSCVPSIGSPESVVVWQLTVGLVRVVGTMTENVCWPVPAVIWNGDRKRV